MGKGCETNIMNTDETTTDTIKTDKSTTIGTTANKPIETTVTGTTTVDTIEKTVKANTTATSEQKTKRLIYLGPNLLEKGLQTFKIFKGGIPENIIQPIEKEFPLINQLFAEVAEMNSVLVAIKTKGTPRYLAYQQITKGSEK